MSISSKDLCNLVDKINERFGSEVANPCSYQYAGGNDYIFWNDICLWDSDNYGSDSLSFVKKFINTEVNKIMHPVHLEYLTYLYEELKHTFKEDKKVLEDLEIFYEEELESLVKGCEL